MDRQLTFLVIWILASPAAAATEGSQTGPQESEARLARLDRSTAGLIYSTLLGGNSSEFVGSITLDTSGNIYLAGETYSSDFPVTNGSYDTTFNGEVDGYVAKLTPDGRRLLFSTFIGGSGYDMVDSIAIGPNGDVYVSGSTMSSDFPTSPSAFQKNLRGTGDMFVARLDPGGWGLLYSTLIGGSKDDRSPWGTWIAVDPNGRALVAGATDSPDFPVTQGAFDETLTGWRNIVVCKIDANGTSLEYSTYIGGGGMGFGDIATDILALPSGETLVAGFTTSVDFPTTPGAFRTALRGNSDGFVLRLDRNGSKLVSSTLFGGSAGDSVFAMDVDASGKVYLGGYTESPDIPTSAGAFDQNLSGPWDGFIASMDPALANLLMGTYLGGSDGDSVFSMDVTPSGSALAVGNTLSSDFPTDPDSPDRRKDGKTDAFLARIDSAGGSLATSTFLGGNESADWEYGFSTAIGDNASAWILGETDSADFPTTPDAMRRDLAGGKDIFLTRVDSRRDDPSGAPEVIKVFPAPDSTNVSIHSPIRIEFDTSMDWVVTTSAILVSPPLIGLRARAENHSLALWSTEGLEPNTTHTVTISAAATSTWGSPLGKDVAFHFTTGAGPGRRSPSPAGERWHLEAIPLSIILVAATVLLMIWAVRSESARFALILVGGLLPWRAKGDAVLDHFVRGQIYGYIIANPGVNYTTIRERLGMATGTLVYHLHTLERAEFIRSEREGRWKKFYSRDAPRTGRGIILSSLQKQILDLVRSKPGITQSGIASSLGIRRQKVNYNLKRLARLKLLREARKGWKTAYYQADSVDSTYDGESGPTTTLSTSDQTHP